MKFKLAIPLTMLLLVACGDGQATSPASQGLRMGQIGPIFPTIQSVVEKEWRSQKILRSSRLNPKSNFGSSLGSVERQKAVRKFLGDRGLHPLVQLVESPTGVGRAQGLMALSVGTELKSNSYALRVGAYDVCDVTIRTVETPSGRLHALGVIPNVSTVSSFSDDAWQPMQTAVDLAMSRLRSMSLAEPSMIVTKSNKCLYAKNQKLSPAWQIVLSNGLIPYQFFVGHGEIYEGNAMAFDITAKVKAYATNPVGGNLTDFDVPVSGDGYLTNEYFTTISGNAEIPRQQSVSNTFTQGPESKYFAEQSAFVHVNRHFDFASANGYVWTGPKPLKIWPNRTQNGKNEATYYPFDGQFGPSILLGSGDGVFFQNLMNDSDVMSHEFGHHIIYASVTEFSGDSRVIHEGLADAIAFVKSGDSCLGESICPMSTSAQGVCQVNGRCLRTGDTNLKYEDNTYKSYAGLNHLRGQVISGLFWDLYQAGKIPVADLQKLAIMTPQFLPSKADMAALITAILDVDFAIFGQRYQKVLLDAASARGLGPAALGITIDSIDGVEPQRCAANAPKVTGPSIGNNPKPTWAWTSGGGGSGTFRYSLDNPDLTTGSTVTKSLSFTPPEALEYGDHTLYVQESDASGMWSPSGRKTISIDKVKPIAQVTGALPGSPNSAKFISLQIAGDGVIDYQFAIIESVTSTCTEGVNYGDWIPVSSSLVADITSSANRFFTLCLIGRDKTGDMQSKPSIYTWLRHNKAPRNTIAAQFATIGKGYSDKSTVGGKQIITFTRSSNIKVTEKATALLCKYNRNTGLLTMCLSREAIFRANSAGTNVLFSPMSLGDWVAILLPSDPNRGRANPLLIKY